VIDAVGDTVIVVEALTVEDPVMDAVPVPEPDCEGVTVILQLPLPVLDAEAPGVREAVDDALTVLLAEVVVLGVGAGVPASAVGDPVGVDEGVPDGEPEGVPAGETSKVREVDCVGMPETLGVGVGEGEGVLVALPLEAEEAEAEPVAEGGALAVAHAEVVPVPPALPLPVALAQPLPLPVALAVAPAVAEAPALPVAEPEGLPVGTASPVGAAEALVVGVGGAVREGLPVGVAAPPVSVAGVVAVGVGGAEPEGALAEALGEAPALALPLSVAPLGEAPALALPLGVAQLGVGAPVGVGGAEGVTSALWEPEREGGGEGASLGEGRADALGAAVSDPSGVALGAGLAVAGAQATARTRLLPPSPTKSVTSAASMATPTGAENSAPPRAGPSAKPATTLPAYVLTLPQGLTTRTRPEMYSATYSCPLTGPTAIPVGRLKVAAAPTPSMPPATPLPASVATTPYAIVTMRSRWPSISATYRAAPAASTARPQGVLKVAKVPGPSAPPAAPVPATVDTTPPASNRILLLEESATYTAPVAPTTATDAGRLKVALSAGPSAAPTAPVPANELTAPVATNTTRSALLPWSAT
jgi:hypothetical protein